MWCGRPKGSGRSGRWNGQVTADLAHQQFLDLVVAWDRAAAIQLRVVPPGMIASLPQQRAAVLLEVAEQIATLHRVKASSS